MDDELWRALATAGRQFENCRGQFADLLTKLLPLAATIPSLQFRESHEGRVDFSLFGKRYQLRQAFDYKNAKGAGALELWREHETEKEAFSRKASVGLDHKGNVTIDGKNHGTIQNDAEETFQYLLDECFKS